MSNFMNMHYGDQLKNAIEQLNSSLQKTYFLSVYNRLEAYVQEHQDAAESITLQEFMDMYGR